MGRDIWWWLGGTFWGYVKSVAPLALVLVAIRVFVLKSSMESVKEFVVALGVAAVGLMLFVEGANRSLVVVAKGVGEGMGLGLAAETPTLNRPAVLFLAFLIGLLATMVEPALLMTAKEFDNTVSGAVRYQTLMGVTAFGFAAGMALGVAKIIYDIDTVSIMLPLLALALVLTYFCGDVFAGLAFDCASATTGPVNIPVNLGLAVALAAATGADPMKAGFGIVGLTCLGAGIAVMAYGVIFGQHVKNLSGGLG